MPQPSVREAAERIDALLDELAQSAVPAVADRVDELLQSVMALYGAGLARVVEAAGPQLLRALADDDVVGSLLVLHDLHPDDVDTRVQRALEQVRPYLGSHAGDVELSGVDEQGVVHLRLRGSCDGCPSSALTVAGAIEDAVLAAAPDVVGLDVEGLVDTGPRLLQLEPFRPHDEPRHDEPRHWEPRHWEPLRLHLAPRTTTHVRVAASDLLVAELDGTLVAYLDGCPACGAPLHDGLLAGDTLSCGCGSAYDLRRAGRAVRGDTHLEPVPLLPEDGAWKVSVPGQVPA
jgi:Fe-S cluster biogenesis protein NfuA/nitrite reductase/ring-hydroxylating ferredoxin subunit